MLTLDRLEENRASQTRRSATPVSFFHQNDHSNQVLFPWLMDAFTKAKSIIEACKKECLAPETAIPVDQESVDGEPAAAADDEEQPPAHQGDPNDLDWALRGLVQ
eukprot:jgi/Mesvir1/15079/Mv14723-RA.1